MASLHLMSCSCIPIKLWNMVIIPSHSDSWGQNDFITLREHSRLDPHNTPGAGGAFSSDCDIIAVTCQYSSSSTAEKTFHNSLFTIDCLFVGLSAVKLDICGSALLCLTWHSGKLTHKLQSGVARELSLISPRGSDYPEEAASVACDQAGALPVARLVTEQCRLFAR